MLRTTRIAQNWRAVSELDRVRYVMRGRAKWEKKIGYKRMFFLLRVGTKYRVEAKSQYDRSIVRMNIDSAAREHGSGYIHSRLDLARQKVALLPRMQRLLALYEPLAYRSLMELSSSAIAPEQPKQYPRIPSEVYDRKSEEPNAPSPASVAELEDAVERIMRKYKYSGVLRKEGPKDVAAWKDAWKEYETPKGENVVKRYKS